MGLGWLLRGVGCEGYPGSDGLSGVTRTKASKRFKLWVSFHEPLVTAENLRQAEVTSVNVMRKQRSVEGGQMLLRQRSTYTGITFTNFVGYAETETVAAEF